MKGPPNIHKTKYRKTTNAEIKLRVEQVARLIGEKQLTKTEIHSFCHDAFHVHWRTADRYVARAREFMLEREQKTVAVVRAEAVVFNEGVLRSKTTTTKEKQDARRELNAIFGIYPARQHQITTPPNQPFQTEEVGKVPVLSRQRLLELLSVLAPEESASYGAAVPMVISGNGHDDGPKPAGR